MKIKLRRREPNGQYVRPKAEEREADIISLALYNRSKESGLAVEVCRDQKAGSVIGRLYMSREIDRDQYEAACRWERLIRLYRVVLCAPAPSARSASMAEMVGGSRGDSPEMDIETQHGIRRDYQDAYHALTEHREAPEYIRALKLAAEDRRPNVGDLRCALNVLRHLWR